MNISNTMGKRSLDEMANNSTQTQQATSGAEPMDIDSENTPPNAPVLLQPPPNLCTQRGSLVTLLSRPSPYSNESGPLACGEFAPLSSLQEKTFEYSTASDIVASQSALGHKKVLVVGAGGLGCEILKDLAMSGIRNVEVIDLDTIDVTNLNRQFLFRQADVGNSKAETAARFINNRCPWMNVKAHHGMIQDKDPNFYAGFDVVISGLDNIEARRWLNATIVGLVEFDDDGDIDPTTIIPLVDGGTEAFAGQARFILPRLTSCFECTIDAFPPATNFPLCTIAETPRRPEHCIAYAYILQWPRTFPDKKLDKDSPEDMQWVYEKARERAEKYKIAGVTYMMTMGVVKNIIPAVASTNAIIAAACVNEAVKYLTYCSQNLNTYMMYMGAEGVHTHTFAYQLKEDCPVSRQKVRPTKVSCTKTLNELMQELRDGPLRLQNPSMVSASGQTLYMAKPPALEKATRPNLDKALSVLLPAAGEEVTVTDPVLGTVSINLSISFV